MDHSGPWQVVLVMPGEAEVAVMAALTTRGDGRILGIVDPSGQAVGTAIAELLGLPVWPDLGSASLEEADCLVYAADSDWARDVVARSPVDGVDAVTGGEFMRRLKGAHLTRRAAPSPPEDFESLELEAEAIHRSLTRIEEAFQRETLLRWLLSLATRSVGATSGSLMLHDDKSGELYIAFAFGLSESTQHRTRLALGEGVAGRVAMNRRSELVRGRLDHHDSRDRPDIAAAISTPLQWEGRLLGVLNVSVTDADPPLGEDDLATLDRFARRIGLILHRFLDVQKVQTGHLFQQADLQFHQMMRKEEDFQTLLATWAGTLALDLEADRCSLAVVCDDGSYLVAEGRAQGETSVWNEAASNRAWTEVRRSRKAMVVRRAAGVDDAEAEMTVFYLPLGSDPVLAVLTAVFTTAAAAHHFRTISGEILHLLERRLWELVGRVTHRDRLSRLADLATALTEIVTTAGVEGGTHRDRVLATARGLTGARLGYLVTGVQDGIARLAGPNVPEDQGWLKEAGRLMTEVPEGRWRVTMVSDLDEPKLKEASLLAVKAGPGAAPGMILLQKERMHPLDGAVFSEFDGELAARLARLLELGPRRPARSGPPTEPGPETSSAQLEPAAAPETPAGPEGEASEEPSGEREPVPASRADAVAGGADTAAPDAAASAIQRAQRETLAAALRREMDRADRYHGIFALTAFRPLAPDWEVTRSRDLVVTLQERIRSSDLVVCLDDGTILVLLPEDVQSIPRQQRRVSGLLRDFAGLADLEIATSHTIYPGRHNDPAALLADTLAGLD